MDESQIYTWSIDSFLDCIDGLPHPLNDDRWGEGITPQKEEVTTGDCKGEGSPVVHDLIVDYRVEVGDRGKGSKEHVDKGVVMLLVSFASRVHAFVGRVKSKDKY